MMASGHVVLGESDDRCQLFTGSDGCGTVAHELRHSRPDALRPADVLAGDITRKDPPVRTALFAALLCALSTAVCADFRTLGAPDCDQWTTATGSLQMQHRVWLLGFLSGMNAVRYFPDSRNNWLQKLSGAEQAFLWIDDYCRIHPEESVVQGGLALSDELQALH